MKPKWLDSADKHFAKNFVGGAGSPKWIARTCCEVFAWIKDRDNPIVNIEAVTQGIEAYKQLHSGKQPFEDLEIEIETSFPYRPLSSSAAQMGSRGGLSTSPAKVSASRSNGKNGGRPNRKVFEF